MRVNFLVNEIHINGQSGWEPTDTRLGGTEKAVVEWAEELVKRGHKVTVYMNGRNFTQSNYVHEINGVSYCKDRGYYQGRGDVCINIKSSDVAPKEPTLYYTNEMNASELDLSAYDGVIHISKYAKDNIPVNNPNVYIVPHGYDATQIYPGDKIPKQCFYASSPDRGLETLLEAWPSVYEAHPDATLLVTYNGTGPSLPGVMYMGDCDEELMNDIYRTSDIWCHPCNGGELYCITGIKAQAAGCVPVIIPTMALQETVKHYVSATKEAYADALIATLSKNRDDIRKSVLSYRQPTIQDSTDKLLKVINKVIRSK